LAIQALGITTRTASVASKAIIIPRATGDINSTFKIPTQNEREKNNLGDAIDRINQDWHRLDKQKDLPNQWWFPQGGMINWTTGQIKPRSSSIDMVDGPETWIPMFLSGAGEAKLAAEAGSTIIGEGTELTFFRGMSKKAGESFLETGKMPASMGETMISPTKAFAADYGDMLFEINVKSSTLSELEEIGVRNIASEHPYEHLPVVKTGWKPTNAFFKLEGEQVNIGLGNGKALHIFNANIKSFKLIP
jgi:hypothetical protein